MQTRAKAIFFDLGETLVTQNIEDSLVTRSALEKISKMLPKPVSATTLFRLYMKGYQRNDAIRSEYNVEIPIQAWIPQLLKRVIGTDSQKKLVERCVSIIVKARAANAVPFEDAHQALKAVSGRKLKLGVMSNVSSHEVALAILNKVQLARYFDIVITSALTGIRKPDPGIFRYALYQLGISPDEAVIVGDSERHDIRGGYISGFHTVLISRRRNLEGSMADYQFRSLADAISTLRSL